MKAKREDQRKLDEGNSRYHCRLCGDPLPAGFPGLFHRHCLIEDKKWRTQEQRRREKERFAKWLSRQKCTRCGTKLGQNPNHDRQLIQKIHGEGSRGTLELRKASGPRKCTQEMPEIDRTQRQAQKKAEPSSEGNE